MRDDAVVFSGVVLLRMGVLLVPLLLDFRLSFVMVAVLLPEAMTRCVEISDRVVDRREGSQVAVVRVLMTKGEMKGG